MSKTTRSFDPSYRPHPNDYYVDQPNGVIYWKDSDYVVYLMPLINGSLKESIASYTRKWLTSGRMTSSCPKGFRKQQIRSDRRRLNVELIRHLREGIEDEFLGYENPLPYWN